MVYFCSAAYTSQAASGNYSAITQTATFTVAGHAPTIIFTVPSHAYGDAAFSVSATSNSSGAITYSVLSGPATISGSTVTLTGTGTVVLQASQAAVGTYISGTQNATFTVAQESQTITFTAPTSPVTYSVSPITLVATGGTSSNAVVFSVVSGPATVSGSTLTITGVGTVVVAANQAGNANYSAATQVTQSIVVNQATQTITFTAPTSPVTYSVSPITLVATGGASSNAVIFSVVSGPATVSGSTLTITGVGTVVVAANQAGNANYATATQVTQSIVVTQASQTITFTAPTSPVTFGVSPITLVATGGASSNAVVFSVVSGPATVSGSTLTITGVGTVVVAANQAGNSNYSAATQVTQSIVVTQASQTITFTAPTSPVTYGVSPITLVATGGASSNAVVFSVVSGPATVSGSTLTITGVGTVVVAANQTGNANYATATQVTQSIVVTQASQTITFTAPTSPVTYGVSPIALVATGGASSNAVVFSVVSGPATVSGSTLTITGVGTVLVAANQTGNANYAAATQVTQSIVVNQATQTITFTAPASPVTYGVSPIALVATGGASSNAVVFSVVSGPATVSGSTLTITGVGTVVVAANQTGNANYSAATQVTQSIVVNQATQTITFTAPASPVTYGVSPIALVATGGASGNAVTFSIVSGPGTISGSTLTITGAGTVVVAANQAGNANYAAATQVTQSIVVNVIGVAATPTYSPVAGTYTTVQTVTISDATAGATIYYTTNGTTPTTSSTVYSGAITISATETLEAIATDTGYSSSAVATAAYTIANPAPAIGGISPAFTDAGGAVFTLTVNGSGFIASSAVYWGTSALSTTYVSLDPAPRHKYQRLILPP